MKPYIIVNQVPDEVSNIQAYAALKEFGLLATIVATMLTLPVDDLDRMAWEKATVFKRRSPTVLKLATLFEISEDTLDALFAYASTVVI
jgi:hypothetical protein